MKKLTSQEENLLVKIGEIRNTETFWKTCPYTIDELNAKNRSRKLAVWRQIGMVWYRLSGKSLKGAGKVFDRNHATVLHSIKIVSNAFDGYYPEMLDKIKILIDIDKTNFSSKVYNLEPIFECESLFTMQNLIFNRL